MDAVLLFPGLLSREVYTTLVPHLQLQASSDPVIGVQPESPVVPLQYSRSSRGSREFVVELVVSQLKRWVSLPVISLGDSIKAPLPNLFDERDL